jgi:hypothetical protein
MGKFATLWFWQASRLNSEWFETYSFDTEEYPRPSLTRQKDKPTLAMPWSYSSLDSSGRLVVSVDNGHLPDAPPTWYMLFREYDKPRPTQTLLCFDTNHFSDGTVIEYSDFQKMGEDDSFLKERISAIRWGFGDPMVEQLYVSEKHRRKRVSIKTINVADLVNVAGNWGGFIYGGEQVTELGEKLSQSWTHSSRLQEKKVSLPPMDK